MVLNFTQSNIAKLFSILVHSNNCLRAAVNAFQFAKDDNDDSNIKKNNDIALSLK